MMRTRNFLSSLVMLMALGLTGCASVKRVTFPTNDRGVVEADIFGKGPHGLVLAHGGRFTKESWEAQIDPFVAAGFRVAAINFRGRGASRGGPDPKSEELFHLDVLAAVGYLRQTGAETVSVVGASFGGWAAAKAVATEPDQIDRLVLLAASIDDPEKVTGPKLFILAREDFRDGGILRLPEIRDQYERAPEPKTWVVLEGKAHAQYLFETEQGERVMTEILDFLTAP